MQKGKRHENINGMQSVWWNLDMELYIVQHLVARWTLNQQRDTNFKSKPGIWKPNQAFVSRLSRLSRDWEWDREINWDCGWCWWRGWGWDATHLSFQSSLVLMYPQELGRRLEWSNGQWHTKKEREKCSLQRERENTHKTREHNNVYVYIVNGIRI